jgi:Uma2 family endonuclease
MATASVDPLGQFPAPPIARYFTAADLAAMPDWLPSGSVNFELHQGRLVPMSPTGWLHANLQSRMAKALTSQGEDKELGKVGTEAGVLVSRNPDSVLGPDVVFITTRSMPIHQSPEGYLETIPELIVEIRSKNDTLAELNRKVQEYLRASAKLVWLVDAVAKTVIEHRPGGSDKTYTVSDLLACDDIIPGFRLALAEFFKD